MAFTTLASSAGSIAANLSWIKFACCLLVIFENVRASGKAGPMETSGLRVAVLEFIPFLCRG